MLTWVQLLASERRDTGSGATVVCEVTAKLERSHSLIEGGLTCTTTLPELGNTTASGCGSSRGRGGARGGLGAVSVESRPDGAKLDVRVHDLRVGALRLHGCGRARARRARSTPGLICAEYI
jgi:hypothetical protein